MDDPMDNVAQGMVNIEQSWAIAPSQYVIPMDGTTGPTSVIPGVSGTELTALLSTCLENGVTMVGDAQKVVLLINPQDVYNTYSGTWDPPPGHIWNSKYLYEPKKTGRKQYEEESTGEPEQVIAAGAVAETSDAVLIVELKGSDENDKEDNVDELRTARRRARKQAKRW
ncbi:hypothetical protein PC120_g20968 [Phytophthora cactorum]|nr:hypothetical protein PC120_g20968 [Phytophthora cactorum]